MATGFMKLPAWPDAAAPWDECRGSCHANTLPKV
jgi:hypothetical protein